MEDSTDADVEMATEAEGQEPSSSSTAVAPAADTAACAADAADADDAPTADAVEAAPTSSPTGAATGHAADAADAASATAMDTSTPVGEGGGSTSLDEGRTGSPSGETANAAADDAAAPVHPSSSSTAAPPAPVMEVHSASPVVLDLQDPSIDDTVPYISYEDTEEKRSPFSKDGRWVIPTRDQFPRIFCGLQVKAKFEVTDSQRSCKDLSRETLDEVCRLAFGLGDTFVRWDDCPGTSGLYSAADREVVITVKGPLPPIVSVDAEIEDVDRGVHATVISIEDTMDDRGVERLAGLAKTIKEAPNGDALLFELPQLWIIPDPEFKAKSANIGLYPGSFWMGFFKSWGAISSADVFFRTLAKHSEETKVHLLVKWKSPESLKMCLAFLWNRHLAHPKRDNELRQPAVRIVNYEEFRVRAGLKPGGQQQQRPKAKAKASTPSPALLGTPVKAKAGTLTRVPKAPVPQKARPVVPPATVTKVEPNAAEPKNLAKGGSPPPAITKAGKGKGKGKTPSSTAKPATPASPPAAAKPDSGAKPKLNTAEIMKNLSGDQLKAFEMVTKRMERLELENQELMDILKQMQELLQQQQQRNAKLQQLVGAKTLASAQAAAPQKRKATAPPDAPAPKATAEAQHYAAASEEAPWKSQRKRARRVPRNSAAAGAGGNGGIIAGLAAYHESLLRNR